MVTDDEERVSHAARTELLVAATEDALMALAMDSVEVALVAVEELGGVTVPGDLTSLLWTRLRASEPIGAGPEEVAITELVLPFQPPDEPEEPGDRELILGFAASVVDAALGDTAPPWSQRAGEASFVLGDLHAHIDSLASDEFEDEETRVDLRLAVLGPDLGYDDFSLRRHNELLATMSRGRDIDWLAVRPIVERGKDMLRRALSSLEEAGRL